MQTASADRQCTADLAKISACRWCGIVLKACRPQFADVQTSHISLEEVAAVVAAATAPEVAHF